VGFGHGKHFCLGCWRALSCALRRALRRLEHVELTGKPEWIKSSFVVGFKHLPIRYGSRGGLERGARDPLIGGISTGRAEGAAPRSLGHHVAIQRALADAA
jgi:hypothetical protein